MIVIFYLKVNNIMLIQSKILKLKSKVQFLRDQKNKIEL